MHIDSGRIITKSETSFGVASIDRFLESDAYKSEAPVEFDFLNEQIAAKIELVESQRGS